jgi:hypothetical protein
METLSILSWLSGPLPLKGDIEGVVADFRIGEGEEGPAAESLRIPSGDIDAVIGSGRLGTTDNLIEGKTNCWWHGKGLVCFSHCKFWCQADFSLVIADLLRKLLWIHKYN